MIERIRQFNWSETPLGAVEHWKPSLRSALSICLNSNFPIAIYWGEQLTLLYNDAWSPIPGNKHPWALGKPAMEVWPEIWQDIEPQFAKAFLGEPGGSKNAMLPMQRHGYTEECYFDFTFTPVYGDEGSIDGIFNAVIETTDQLINERRISFLENMSRKIGEAQSFREVFRKLNTVLTEDPADLPLGLIFTLDEQEQPVLRSYTHADYRLKDFPYGEIIKTGQTIYIKDLSEYLHHIPVIFWPEEPTEALLVPFRSYGGEVTGFLFACLSARRRWDADYQLFIERIAGTVSSSLNTIYSLEEQRKRAEALNLAGKKLEESERALRIAKDQLELTFRNVPAAIYLFDKKGKILFLNNEAAMLSNADPEAEIRLKQHLKNYHDRTSQRFEMRDEAGNILSMDDSPTNITLRTGKAAQKIMHFTSRTDGSQKWVLTSTAPLLDEEGKLTMVLTTSTDITIQKNAEEKIRASEEHFRSLTEALPQLVWVTDIQGKQEFVTGRWREYTGMDPRDSNTWQHMIHPDDIVQLAATWEHSMKNGLTYKAEARLKGRDGSFRWFYVHGEPIRDESQEISKWVGAFTDIHEQKMAEEKLRLSEEKLEYQVKSRTEELERSNEDLQQFAHVASHDLKEPIRKIKIFSGLLQEEMEDENNDRSKLYLSKIQSAADRMLSMMEGVLRYAGLDGYEQGIEMVDLNKIIRSVETDLEIVIQKKNARIQKDDLPSIQGYSILIYQLFYNLISNALKFSKVDTEPLIRIRFDEIQIEGKSFARFRIRDNGIGFEPADAEKIFHTFARLNSKEAYEGTGLGLSLCKKIVSRQHGFISASGQPDEGAEFTVELPFSQTAI